MVLHVAVVSGSRADYGPLRPLLLGLAADNRKQLSVIVCAVGCSDEAGRLLAAVADDGLDVAAAIRAAGPGKVVTPVATQAARALEGISNALMDLEPDVVVLLGDRFEIMAAAVGSHLLRIPIVHLSGGDETLGSLDDAMRHAISRLASLHFPTNSEAASRLRALGVASNRIMVVGSTALDELVAYQPLSRAELARSIGTDLPAERLIVALTYHPATNADEPPAITIRAIVAGIRDAAPDASVVITCSNSDAGGADIDEAVREMARSDPLLTPVASLGVERYWSLLHHADVVVGNSSSALIEAPVVGVPVVDVGQRQAGRLRAASCLQTVAQRGAIAAAIREALARPRAPEASPYGDGRAVPRILERLDAIDDPKELLSPQPLAPIPDRHS